MILFGYECVEFIMEDIVIFVRYNRTFVTNEDGSWEYINGRNKVRVIRSNCTYEELQEIVYEVTKINRNSFRIIMKYLFSLML